MMNADVVGYVAAGLTTISFVPQALKVIKERDTRSLSLGMYVTFTVGVVLWGVYGWQKGDWAVLAANLITGALSSVILAIKLRNDVWKGAGSTRRP